MKYIIQLWNPKSRRYKDYWVGDNFEIAERLMHKSYYETHTRRLIQVQSEILYTLKASKNNIVANIIKKD